MNESNTMTSSKATKIIATIGPATESEETIEKLILAGMNVARFNTKHADPAWHLERIKRVHSVAQRLGKPIGILLDLQGPEVRIEVQEINGEKSFMVEEGDEVVFKAAQAEEHNSFEDHEKIITLPKIVIDSLTENNKVMIDDGLGEFVVTKHHGTHFKAKALGKFSVQDRKTLNTPGVIIDLPSLIEQDLAHLDQANDELVDYVGLSFVRNIQDIKNLKLELEKRNLNPWIVAKIENQSALDNLESIIEQSDAIMVARGDLAVEVPFQELIYWQKKIIRQAREQGKPVITATQMLRSMLESPRPTRAEVSDVANAVYDGTDAVMLSEETTIGKYPVKTVTTQAAIVGFNEKHLDLKPLRTRDINPSSFITHSAMSLLRMSANDQETLQVDKLICLTETGTTANLIARFRPPMPIHALTSTAQTYRKLSLLYNVTPHIIELPDNDELVSSDKLLTVMKQRELVKTGEVILLVHGTIWRKPGLTNTVTVLEIP